MSAVPWLESAERKRIGQQRIVLGAMRDRCRQTSVWRFATMAGVDAENLAHVLNGRRKSSQTTLDKLKAVLAQRDRDHHEAE